MRLLAGILACTMVFGATLSAQARDDRPDRKGGKERGVYRSSTIAPNGTCWRDNGRPLDSLNLNQKCDREEFWARMNERGNSRR